jgi:hypothetical protein
LLPGLLSGYGGQPDPSAAAMASRDEGATPPAGADTGERSGDRRLNPIKLRQMKDRRRSIEDEVTRLEVEIADYELALSAFVSVEETKRVNDLLIARRVDLEALMTEWEEVAQLIETNS